MFKLDSTFNALIPFVALVFSTVAATVAATVAPTVAPTDAETNWLFKLDSIFDASFFGLTEFATFDATVTAFLAPNSTIGFSIELVSSFVTFVAVTLIAFASISCAAPST